MIKKYFYIILFGAFLFSVNTYSQDSKNSTTRTQELTIEGLTIYPNPTNTGKINISSKLSLEKKVEIFDVLGKKVFETITTTKEINISTLNPGVYIVKIREAEASATRKLIIN
ncbi:T9SS type A sorting domain-containing protein [Flavobacterium sediminilitoris]|uniref:T9SS type A sorting domain-containing protein n=1 Tax=Flavobacterium sediminilitoris TaxID=2024526 RepID=A0ABY4HU33_9FLAO|nr:MULTISPECIES: T9SS type A sorting domain-containing protein [Flavobacterium]UOX35239.1 T9SS type A sorting domain-containing protein [Flavobacterium sediminilitoris]